MIHVVVGAPVETRITEADGQQLLANLALNVTTTGKATAVLSVPDTWCSQPGTLVWFGIALDGEPGPARGGLYTVATPNQRIPITIERTFDLAGATTVRAVWHIQGAGTAWTGLNAPPQLRVVTW